MNELNTHEMHNITGGDFSLGTLAGSAAAGGFSTGVGAAITGAALAGPIALGALVGATAYLVKEAVSEGISATGAVLYLIRN
jgi:hypothetical protein